MSEVFQARISLEQSLGFDPGPAYGRVMSGIRERIRLRMWERCAIDYWASLIFPEEFKEDK